MKGRRRRRQRGPPVAMEARTRILFNNSVVPKAQGIHTRTSGSSTHARTPRPAPPRPTLSLRATRMHAPHRTPSHSVSSCPTPSPRRTQRMHLLCGTHHAAPRQPTAATAPHCTRTAPHRLITPHPAPICRLAPRARRHTHACIHVHRNTHHATLCLPGRDVRTYTCSTRTRTHARTHAHHGRSAKAPPPGHPQHRTHARVHVRRTPYQQTDRTALHLTAPAAHPRTQTRVSVRL